MTKDSAEEKVIRINCDRAGAIFSKIRGFLPGTNYIEAHRALDDARHEALIAYELYKLGKFRV